MLRQAHNLNNPGSIPSPVTNLSRLRAWLKTEWLKEYGAGQQHVLHLWDWEVAALLKELNQG